MASWQYKVFSRFVAILPLKVKLHILFFRRFKRILNLKTSKTFNEKIQKKKVFDRNPQLTLLADKIESKKYVKRLVPDVYIPETIWSGTDVKELNFKDLPQEYVFKANHTSQTLKIIRDGQHLELNEMKRLTRNWLMHDQSASMGEWAYKNIKRKVFIEEFLDFNGFVPDDYKFFVYHGKVRFIQLDTGRFVSHKRNMFDRNWDDLKFEYSHKRVLPPPPKPHFFEEMVNVAEKLSGDADFLRVDLYFYNDKVTFSEITVYPGAGFEKFPTKDFDILFGKYWNQIY